MPSTISQLFAFTVAVARYRTVAPVIGRELARWRREAERIPDPDLRHCAKENLRDAAAHVQVAGLILTLAPRPHRARAVIAAVALEVAYDYLDSLTEQPHPDPLAHGAGLYRTFVLAFGGAAPGLDDDYAVALAMTCRLAFLSLPSAPAVVSEARRVAVLCGEAQTRTHATAQLGTGQLQKWAKEHPIDRLAWWETAAGWCASVLVLHALIAAAADPATTPADARAISAAYLHISALTTLLDSLKDREADHRSGAHSFVSYYRDETQLARSLATVAGSAVDAAGRTPHPAHETMTVAGCAAFYCSGIGATSTTAALRAELQSVVSPILAMFRLWRTSSRLRH